LPFSFPFTSLAICLYKAISSNIFKYCLAYLWIYTDIRCIMLMATQEKPQLQTILTETRRVTLGFTCPKCGAQAEAIPATAVRGGRYVAAHIQPPYLKCLSCQTIASPTQEQSRLLAEHVVSNLRLFSSEEKTAAHFALHKKGAAENAQNL
jgi:hypothetical protein